MEQSGYKYFKYLISTLEKEFVSNYPEEKVKVLLKLIGRLKNSDNILRDVYLLSRIKDLEILSAYLLFILKKTSEKQVTFDNLLENIEEDRKFLKNEILNHFADIPDKEEITEEEYVEDVISEENQWHAPSEKNETLEAEFLGTEMISDDFSDTVIEKKENIEKEQTISEYEENESMELIQKENDDKEKIYETPEKTDFLKHGESIKSEEEPKSEEVFNLPEEKRTEEMLMTDNDEIGTPGKKEIKKSAAEKLKEMFHFKKHKKPEKQEQKAEPEKEEEKPAEEISDGEILRETQPPEMEQDKQIKKILIESEPEDYTDYNRSLATEEKAEMPEPESTEEEEKKNELFNQYEKILRERNLIIAEGLNRIKEINQQDKTEETEKEEKSILGDIIENCEYMENYSREMTFEVITNIYSTIKLSLKNVNNTAYIYDEELIDLFINAVILIQKLISGDDYTGYENTVALIEKKQRELIEEKEKRERKEKIKREKEEVEKKLEEKYKETGDRKKLLLLKNKILNVENIFKTLETIKGEFQTYEAHRILSKTFPDFKDIVNLSNELEIENMAKLSEASYVFIKYIQNYRIDPFGSDVKEIFNYIIVNFKLLFLGKTSKDTEIFITYLNNPDKIFTEKK